LSFHLQPSGTAAKYRTVGAAFALGLTVMVAAGPASADVFAYGTLSPFQDTGDFGIVDLTTGTFQQVSQSPGSINGGHVAGLVMGSNDVLYSANEYTPNELWIVNPASGATTLVGMMNPSTGDDGLGSTTSAIYLTDRSGNFYQVNPSTANLTYIANIGAMELSTNSATLYGSLGATLYTINTTTGATTLIGTPPINSSTSYSWEALADIDGLLYGSTTSGGLYTIDTSNDTATYVGGSDVIWGLAPESSGATSSSVPEPATITLLSAALVLFGLERRRTRKRQRDHIGTQAVI
jgi:hypothetical protein